MAATANVPFVDADHGQLGDGGPETRGALSTRLVGIGQRIPIAVLLKSWTHRDAVPSRLRQIDDVILVLVQSEDACRVNSKSALSGVAPSLAVSKSDHELHVAIFSGGLDRRAGRLADQ